MPLWKRNLIVCWFGMFVTGIGMSQIAPVLPLYIKHLGVHNTGLIEQFSGIAYIISAIFSPIWGHAADKFGRKPMLSLGTLSTASIAGSLLGPMIGGFIGENLGLPSVFFLTGGLMLIAFITTLLLVKESFTREDKKTLNIKEIWNGVPEKSLTVVLFVTFFMLALAFYTVEPIITVYIAQISHHIGHVALLAGIAFSVSGLANIIAAPTLGKLSDKIGAQKVMWIALIVAGLIFIPQAFVKDPWQLIGLRFFLGIAMAGLNPSVNTLLKKITPTSLTGRVFGFSMSAGYIGVSGGAVLGGQVAAAWGIRYVFFITSALLLLNAVWVYFKVYKKLR